MSRKQIRIHNTETDNLISNLRGEVGEIVFDWIVMKGFMVQSSGMQTEDIQRDFEDSQLTILGALADKLSDEIVSRLAELGERKIGRLTFYFAQVKLNQLESEIDQFTRFIDKNRFREK